MSPRLMSPYALASSKERFFILLCLVLGLLVLVPILNRFVAARIFLDIFLTALVISMAYTISPKKRLPCSRGSNGNRDAGIAVDAICLSVQTDCGYWHACRRSLWCYGCRKHCGLYAQVRSGQPRTYLRGHTAVSAGSTHVGISLNVFRTCRSGIV